MILDDEAARTVRLPVKYADGRWVLEDGDPLPAIRNGSLGELVLPAHAIVDKEVRSTLTEERRFPFLEKDSMLWAHVDDSGVPEELKETVKNLRCWAPQGRMRFVEFVLQEPLFLILRENKNARLGDCKCMIPSLKKEAKSVNHAYTLISTAYEPKRTSHSGNVFNKVYYLYKFRDNDYLRELDDRRAGVAVIYARKHRCEKGSVNE